MSFDLTLSPQERLLLVSALGVYQTLHTRGDLELEPLGGTEAIHELLAKLVTLKSSP